MKKEKSEGYWEIGDKKTNEPTEVISWLMVEKAKLEEENKKLKNDLMEDMKEITKLEEDNKKLKAIIEHYKKFEEGKEKLEGMLMEEDTLQELKDIGEL